MPATRAAIGARGAPARRAVLKARAADMVGREEMDCGMGELAELAFGGVEGWQRAPILSGARRTRLLWAAVM